MRINHLEWYPCYVNPDFNEILELAGSGWDTCRILIADDLDDFIIGSGYGNTHSSIVERYRIHRTKKRCPQTTPYILYHENGIAYMNCEDISGKSRERFDSFSKYFSEKHQEILKDLIRESELAL